MAVHSISFVTGILWVCEYFVTEEKFPRVAPDGCGWNTGCRRFRVWVPQGRNAVVVRRTWKEEDIFKWAPSDRPDFQDRQIAGLIEDMMLKTLR